jgi:hypothetical protein
MTVLIYSRADHDWRSQAPCRIDPDYWYPAKPKSQAAVYLAQIEDAKATCRACPVLAQCKADVEAIEGNCGEQARHGIRAAMTGRERYKAYIRRKAEAEAQAAA